MNGKHLFNMSNWEDWWDHLPNHPANETDEDDLVTAENPKDEYTRDE